MATGPRAFVLTGGGALGLAGRLDVPVLQRSALEILLRSVGLVLGHVTADHLAQLDPTTVIHVLPAPVVGDSSILDFRHTAELITQGRSLTERYLRDVA